MKKTLWIIVAIIISGLFISHSYSQGNVAILIYETYFKNVVRISIINAASSGNEDEDIASIEQLNIIKNEMRNIVIIKKYTNNPNYGGAFKNNNFRLMCITVKIKEKKHKVREILYSTHDAVMIAREDDIFPDKKPQKFGEKIAVYEFKIPPRVNDLIKQCENRLPKEGFYFNTWTEKF
ncbi:hypothetical protein EDC14_10621 [Hydrogenispora ethanolica]|uniref:Uncharacterized protein n=1 Tax=Hydrogenispora ethanolica TaxID=1082276 RepID=A0A4R1QNN0_HYDET|nr:hypothetical protein [Hydrogenispora ethanolica]TCL54573.1 hypothetical protein EDC14_10621 [Hydrogenispora ethanolica]